MWKESQGYGFFSKLGLVALSPWRYVFIIRIGPANGTCTGKNSFYSQLARYMEHVCSSCGYRSRCMSQLSVREILSQHNVPNNKLFRAAEHSSKFSQLEHRSQNYLRREKPEKTWLLRKLYVWFTSYLKYNCNKAKDWWIPNKILKISNGSRSARARVCVCARVRSCMCLCNV